MEELDVFSGLLVRGKTGRTGWKKHTFIRVVRLILRLWGETGIGVGVAIAATIDIGVLRLSRRRC